MILIKMIFILKKSKSNRCELKIQLNFLKFILNLIRFILNLIKFILIFTKN